MTNSGVRLANTALESSAPDRQTWLRQGRALLAWWLSELAGLLPDVLRDRLSGESGRAGVLIEGDTLRLADLRGGQARPLDKLDLKQMTAAEARGAIARALSRAGLTGCPVVLGLPDEQILRRCEFLPEGAERRVGDVLRLRLESAAPLPPGTFHWGYKIAGPAADGQLPVECVLVKAETVNALVARMAELNVELSGMFPAADFPGQATLNLLPQNLRRETLPLWSPFNRVLAALACVLAVLVLVLTFYRQEAELSGLRGELADLRERAESVLALRSGTREQLRSLQAVRQTKAAAPSPMGILNELSRLLPDNSWVSDFRLADGEIQLTGQSRSASSLIGLIERSPMFANVRFGSPVVRDPRTGAERFNMRFEWVKAADAPAGTKGGGP